MLSDLQNHARTVDNIMRFIVTADVILLSIVVGAMLFFVYKYNKKRHPKAVSIHGNVPLEVLWTVVPVILVLYMFYLGWEGFIQTFDAPRNAMPVKVIGRQWSWSFQYENGKQSDTLYLPQGRAVKFLITSVDVIHGFYIPAFREKQDAVPGRVREMVLYPENLGIYEITCSMYCGLDHALMATKMVVEPPQVFDKWVNAGTAPKIANSDSTKSERL
jgi:cytochrome c oxidase subunit 2